MRTPWILVIGQESRLSDAEGAARALRQLGSDIKTATLWDDLEALTHVPPLCVVIDCIDQVEAARAIWQRCTSIPKLAGIPVLLGVSVDGLSRVKPDDPFDDIVLHPYVGPELYLRIRRAEWKNADFSQDTAIKIGPMHIDAEARSVSVHGQDVALTFQEFELLLYLCRRRDRVFSRQQLLAAVWDLDYAGGTRTVDIHVRRLRKKLGDGVALLETVRGVGYKLRAP